MFRIELREVVIERVAVHDVQSVGSGQEVEVLAQTLFGAGRIPATLGVELSTRSQAADKQTQS